MNFKLYIFISDEVAQSQMARQREMIGHRENWHFTEPPHYMPHHTINGYISQNLHIYHTVN